MKETAGALRHRASIVVLVVLWTVAPMAAASAFAQSRHPLDPLSADEIEVAARTLRDSPHFPAGSLFSTIVLKEPDKSEVLGFTPTGTIARQAFSVILDRQGNRTFESVVDLQGQRILSWREVKGVQPLVLVGEYEMLSRIVKADTRWQEAVRRRGIDDIAQVQVDGWAVGEIAPAYRSRRMMRALSYLKGSSINFYGRPIEGVVALVDMNAGRVVEVEDTGIVPIAPPGQELDEESTGRREAPKPLSITQPGGVSFEIDGQQIRWQKWSFRYSMHPREGLVLHTIGYEDGARIRPILYRVSLSEMVVPYGDTDRGWRWRSAFDVGEYSVGRLASSIEPKTDAPENATLLDATFADDEGKPYVQSRAIGLYERDGGMLWKHYEGYSGRNESRRGRQLVIFFIATIGNYDYAINWVFHQDGTLEVDAALSGIMLPKGVRAATAGEQHGTAFPSGHLVSANVVAPHHQHFFSFRLDFDVDGQRNSLHEMNTRSMPVGRGNPSLNGMIMEETRLATEAQAQRRMSMQSARTWTVLNPSARNALGHHTSYIIVPGANSLPFVAPSSPVRRRAAFINNHLWGTRYKADEMSAAGSYPNQGREGQGLPRWVADNESLAGQDLVIWYTLGVTHIPRPEEWPVMPVTHVGFKLIPGGFFSRNPALDVPR
ncbi:MAG TPA: primary-amine oxidase [Gemmatimonadaceae bacterium]|nr:primary-amine oxidase [Gemmatimonadaceae bacterium]